MSTERKIYAAAMRAASSEELHEIIDAARTLADAGALDDADTLRAALDPLYWNSYYRRVMVDTAAG